MIKKLEGIIQQKLFEPQPQTQEKKEEPPTKKRKQTSKKPYQTNRRCHFRLKCRSHGNCGFRHSE